MELVIVILIASIAIFVTHLWRRRQRQEKKHLDALWHRKQLRRKTDVDHRNDSF